MTIMTFFTEILKLYSTVLVDYLQVVHLELSGLRLEVPCSLELMILLIES